ncbi:MAG: DNA-processing protein DprA [Halanaerobiales bacterium]|nr:DNA-processing protein DprA [Halanaerobiales bacterium]
MNRKYWVGLSLIPGVGSLRVKRLIEYFKTPERVWRASKKELVSVPLIGSKLAQKIIDTRSRINLELFLRECKEDEIHILCLEDSEFPVNLKQIYDPPPVIYYRGSFKKEDLHSIAIVGSRKMTVYGRRVTRTLVRELVKIGFTIVSGMARGIDGNAHQTAIEEGGRTIAVLGSGVDVIYPKEHGKLYQEIIQSGAVLSTYPPKTPPEKGNFPARNRIISGLSYGTVVIEAGVRSGAMITADQALEQNREVFAVPGSIFSTMSQGTNELIKKGAKLTTSVQDILHEFGGLMKEIKISPRGKNLKYTAVQEQIITLLKEREMGIDELVGALNLDISKLNAILLELELLGLVIQYPGPIFALN